MELNHEIKQYKERLSIALRAARICVFEVDLKQQLYTFFDNSEAIFGVLGDSILEDVRPFSKLDSETYRKKVSEYFVHPDDEQTVQKAFSCMFQGKPTTYEARMKVRGSGYIWCKVDVTPILEEGSPVRMIGVITDIEAQKKRMKNLEQAAKLDHFTGLYNKSYTISSIKEILTGAKEEKYALLLLDIDNFKHFNDVHGHAKGDKMILTVARKLKETFPETDIIGRFGGDEFLALVRDDEDPLGMKKRLRQILRFQTAGIVFTNSIGIALFPQDAEDFNDLFYKADTALYQAKELKESFVFYSDGSMNRPDIF